MEQTFTFKNGLAAVAWVKGLFRGRNENIPPQAIVDRLSPGLESPPMPEAMSAWNALTREKLQGTQVEVRQSAICL